MFDIFGKYKNIVIGIIIIMVILLVIYFLGKRSGKLKVAGPQGKYPHDGDAIPTGWKAEPLREELFNVMDGVFTLASTKDETFQKYLSLPTDDMFVAVYNVFNQKFFNKGKGTLRIWINDESNTVVFDSTIDDLNVRFDRLNLE